MVRKSIFDTIAANTTVADVGEPVAGWVEADEAVSSALAHYDPYQSIYRPPYFGIEGNRITHYIHILHLDTLPMKLSLLSMCMELEYPMLRRLQWAVHTGQPLGCLSPGRLDKARELCKRKYKEETPERIIECTQFVDKAQMFLSDRELAGCLPFDDMHDAEAWFRMLERLRNQVAHSGSILSVVPEGDLSFLPRWLGDFVDKLRQVTHSVIQANNDFVNVLRTGLPVDYEMDSDSFEPDEEQ